MDLEKETVLVGEENKDRGTRKRMKRKSKREQEYENRYRDTDPNLMKFEPPCQHREGRFRCCSIPVNTLYKAKRAVFANPNRKQQDMRLSFLLDVNSPKRRRIRGDSAKVKPTAFTVKYHVNSTTGKVPVCAAFFRKLFGINQTRANTIAKGIASGKGVIDKRGGDHKIGKYEAKRNEVVNFLSKLKATESHYNRNKSQRLYLSCDLSINKLFKMYNNIVGCDLRVKKSFFSKIFNTKFNLGFGTPASDTCSYCIRMRHAIQNAEDGNKKQQLMLDLRAHRLKAKAFHNLMKQKPDSSKSFAFDLQQVQPLPKLNIGEAYYARQISFYCFCVTNVEATDPTFYVWNETQAGRGPQEISSAVTDFLSKVCIDEATTTLRLFADGCGGQNKNRHLIHAVAFWLLNKSPPHLKEVCFFFPVRGHSFLPADRVFGRIEKKLRKIPEIVIPEKYMEVYNEVGETRHIGNDWQLKDYKVLSEVWKKIDGISEVKRIVLKKYYKLRGKNEKDVKYKTELHYYMDDPTKSFTTLAKRGYRTQTASDITELPLTSRIKEEKRKDVEKLLILRFGEDWRSQEELNFFKEALDLPCTPLDEENTDCNCLQEEPGLYDT